MFEMVWTPDQISFELDELTDDPVVTIEISTPAGTIKFMAEAEEAGAVLILRGAHVQGEAVGQIGVANLRAIVRIVVERLGYDAIEIEGAARTTGANPGRIPSRIRFTR